MTETTTEIQNAWQVYNRKVVVENIRIGCYIGFFLMPAGYLLDIAVYGEAVGQFLGYRLLCSLLIALFYVSLLTPFGRKHCSLQGLILFTFPTFFICLMIMEKDGPLSPYYAGLNLVYLVLGLVLHWSLLESLIGFLIVMVMYLAACAMHLAIYHPVYNREEWGIFGNNLYFITLTGIIVAVGNYFKTRLRFSEFSSRFELDQNKRKLEENNQKLLELNRVKDRFFANISHELRTPLTLLLAPLETLLYRFQGDLDLEIRDMLKGMQANAMRLLNMINDLLDLVRLESGRLEVKKDPLDLKVFLEGLMASTQQMATEKRIRLGCDVSDDLGIVLTDKDKMEKVFLNLLFNALKFTPENGKILLTAAKNGDRLVFTVRDTGVGIARKSLPHIFDRFWQADGSAKRKFQGVGIGLSMVKELVEVQGGRVEVDSTLGEGTVFTIDLPHHKGDDAQVIRLQSGGDNGESEHLKGRVKPGMQTQEWISDLYRRAELFPTMTPGGLREESRVLDDSFHRRHSILIADDEPQMRSFLRSQLTSNFEVHEAVDGQDALDKALENPPDIILLDLMMPNKDGLQTCREMRQSDLLKMVPVILLTARADEDAKLDALTAGASDFLSKPFSTTELHIRIKNLVESSDYQKELDFKNKTLGKTIHQLKETESQLVQSEKLASLGRLSAGIIHEINNPLNFTNTGLFTLRKLGKRFPGEMQEDFLEILTDVEQGIDRVKHIVNDLRTFTHPGKVRLEEIQISGVVATALRFVSSEIKDEVSLETSIPADLKAHANGSRLIQVLVNLLQNSIDSVKKMHAEADRRIIGIKALNKSGRCHIHVRDNGGGIDPEKVDKIFDPFFTTKDVGQGMGLGLSICYRIMKQFEGDIRVVNQPGEFCEMILELAAVEPGVPAPSGVETSPS